ncbi:MAG TPA: winged helix-turn-helix transcriptional regulator [Desulfonatronum sp.]|nr:winged helix-turn-helix transcriptional regulator [Desulfonatronum sp.]
MQRSMRQMIISKSTTWVRPCAFILTVLDGFDRKRIAEWAASNPRNKQIAGIFKEAGLIEKYGSGIVRVHRTMLQAGAPAPLFEPMAHSFKVTLFPVGNGGVNALLSHVRNHPGQNTGEISQALGLPRRTVERRIKELKSQGRIEFRGAPKTGGYHAC